MTKLKIETPEWAEPLLEPCRYKGAAGGRGSGKSHFFAELLVEEHIAFPELQSVCIREIQKSLKFSAKKLIEDKIRSMGVSHLFEITLTEIRRIGHTGLIIFQGMQDHTADSIKSLEGFNRAWVEEAQSLSARSMELLLPTIRERGSEIWFSWNPDQPTDAVEALFNGDNKDSVLVRVNFEENPFCPPELIAEAQRHLRSSPDTYEHVWHGAYNTKSDAQVLNGKWRLGEMPIIEGEAVYFGADWGFSQDPTTLIKMQITENTLYVYGEIYAVGIEVIDTPTFFDSLEESRSFKITADSARPEIISHMKRDGFKIEGAKKGKGSVEAGIGMLRSFDEIVIHPDCVKTIEEARLWSYKTDKASGQVLPTLIDAYNHCWDAIRYALEWRTKGKTRNYSSWA